VERHTSLLPEVLMGYCLAATEDDPEDDINRLKLHDGWGCFLDFGFNGLPPLE
jgi:hypothetical protein